MGAETVPGSVDDLIEDILGTMRGMRLSGSETVLLNFDFTDRMLFPDPEAFFSPRLSSVTELRGRRSVHVRYDSRIDTARTSTVASSSMNGFDAYRLVFFEEEEKDFTLQYATSNMRNAITVLRRLRRLEEVTVSLFSLSYAPFLAPDLDEDSLAGYFDAILPACLRVPNGSEIISALAEKRWRLYEVHGSGRTPYISVAGGSAELLIYGRQYSLVPAMGDETERESIISAVTHATATQQFILRSGTKSLPIVMLHFGTEKICLVDCYGNHQSLTGRPDNFPGFIRRHFNAYDQNCRIAEEKLH